MVRRSEEGPTSGEPDLTNDVLKDGWSQAVSDMRAMARDRETKGFEAITLVSHDTSAIAPDRGDDGRFGLSHLLDSDGVETFTEVYEDRDFTDTGVYQTTDGGHTFMVTEHIDYDNDLIVFIAGTFRMANAAGLVRAAMDRAKLYTYVRDLDRETLGTFEHDDPSDFFPTPDLYYSYEPQL
jgi:hypothetical protein